MTYIEGTPQAVIDLDNIVSENRVKIDEWLNNVDSHGWTDSCFTEIMFSYRYMKRTLDKLGRWINVDEW